MKQDVLFGAKPNLKTHESGRRFNERYEALIPQVQNLITEHVLFADEEHVEVTFAQTGVSSLVCRIVAGDKKYILKMPLWERSFSGEAAFLRSWEEDGISVPHVVEHGHVAGHPYLLMDYVDAPRLVDAYDYEVMCSRGMFRDMGSLLHAMHARTVDGYGRVKGGVGEYESLPQWLFGDPHMRKNIAHILHSNILPRSDFGSFRRAIAVVYTSCKAGRRSTLCHGDFSRGNIFATRPLTVFDPNPMYNHPYIDVGQSLLTLASARGDSSQAIEQFLEGYFGTSPYNEQELYAATYIRAVTRLSS